VGIDVLVFVLKMFNYVSVCRHETDSTDSLASLFSPAWANAYHVTYVCIFLTSLHISLDVVYIRAEW